MIQVFQRLHPYLVLGRTSNLPTVWSNVLAGWLLGGASTCQNLVLCSFSATLLYLGGMYLNDFCDATHDSIHRKERPIPSRQVSPFTVAALGGLFLLSGIRLGFLISTGTGIYSIAISLLILLYDFYHKNNPFAFLLMGSCRALLYPMAASSPFPLVSPQLIISSLAMGCYVGGISLLAKDEARGKAPSFLSAGWLLAPLFACWICPSIPVSGFLKIAGTLLFLAWIICLVLKIPRAWFGKIPLIPRLIAGITLVDLLLTAQTLNLVAAFLLLGALTMVFQRKIPAS